MGATFGTMVLTNGQRTWNVDCSIPDAVATNYTFDMTGLSSTTSPVQFRSPCSGWIIDIVLATAPTAVGCTVNVNSVPQIGSIFRYTQHLNTAIDRVPMRIPVKQGDLISVLQW